MKLVYAIVNRDDSKSVLTHLTKSGFYVTKLATTGGFLGSGNTTFMICDEDEKIPHMIDIIRKYSKKRTEYLPANDTIMQGVTAPASAPLEVTIGGATIIVTEVTDFMKI
ncbi:MAG: cyclic-di-AMP receptor [Ruminococcus sp.]|jgi:uncharacterized protein YaaQ|nr:cyclic-di-AMP receptor [Ruminococcus sp.]